MSEELGRGHIQIDVRENVRRDLDKAKADYERGMAGFKDREAELRFNNKDFFKKFDPIKKNIDDLEKKAKDLKLAGDTKGLKEVNKLLLVQRGQMANLRKVDKDNFKLVNQMNAITRGRIKLETDLTAKTLAGRRKVADFMAKAHSDAIKMDKELSRQRLASIQDEANAMNDTFDRRSKWVADAQRMDARWERDRLAALQAEAHEMNAAFDRRAKMVAEAQSMDKRWERDRLAGLQAEANAMNAAFDRRAKWVAEAQRMDARMERDRFAAIQAEANAMDAAFDRRIKMLNEAHGLNERFDRDRFAAIQAEANAMDAAFDRRMSQLRAAHDLNDRIDRQRLGSLMDEARHMDRAFNDSQALHNRELGQVARLKKAYFDLARQRQKVFERSQKVFLGDDERQKINLDLSSFDEQLAIIRARLATIGEPPPEVDIRVNEEGTQSLSRWMDLITSTTVRLGPFTTTVGGAIRVFALLGPAIVGVVGALGALTGALGAAALGFAGIATGGVLAFGVALGSVGLLLPTLMKDFKNLNTLQDAYHKQVLKTGKNSEKAKTKLQEFRHALKEVGPGARGTFKALEGLKKNWGELSKQSRPAFMGAMKEAFTTANSFVKTFGPDITKTFGMVAGGVGKAFKSLRGKEAKGIIKGLFTDAREALPSFGRGLANIGASIGRIGAAFAHMLPSMGKGFETWTDKLVAFSKNGDKVEKFVKKTTGALRSFGHLLQSTGQFLGAFFGAGVKSGVGLMDDMADGLDRMTKSIKSGDGVSNFFGDSVDTAKDLYGVLKPLATLFIEWATIMRPFTNIALQFAGGLGKILAAASGFGPTRAVLVAAFGIFLTGTLIGKILSIGKAIGELRAAMIALGKVQIAGSLLNVLTGGLSGRLFGGKFGGKGGGAAKSAFSAFGEFAAVGAGMKGAEKAASSAAIRIGATEVAAAGAGTALAGMGTAASIAATGGIALAIGGVGFLGYKLLTAKSSAEKFRDSLKETDNAAKNLDTAVAAGSNAVVGAGQAMYTYNSSLKDVAKLKRELNALERKGGTDTEAYKAKLDELNAALITRETAEANAAKFKRLASKHNLKAAEETDKLTEAETNLKKAQDKQREAQEDYDLTGSLNDKEDLAGATKAVADAEKALARTQAARGHAERQAAVDMLNYGRALKNFIPIAGQAGTAIAKLAKRNPKLAQTISLKYADPKDAGRVAAKASNAIKKGVNSQVVLRIVANSKSAEDAIRKLRALSLPAKKQEILTSGGPAAIRLLESIIGRKLTKKEQKIAQAGGPAVLAMLGKILGIKIPRKTAHVDARTDRAMSAIGAILARMGQLRNKQVYIDTYYRTHGNATPGGQAGVGAGGAAQNPGGAMGGKMSPNAKKWGVATGASKTLTALDKRIAWAANNAGANTVATKGGRYSRPTFLVGEENRSEYVIATNPAYRKRNFGILSSAAKQFGATLIGNDGREVRSAAGGYSPLLGPDNKSIGKGFSASMSHKKPPPGPGKKPKRLPRKPKARKQRQGKAYKRANQWTNYIGYLKTHQTDLEREISIREMSVQEPTELVVESAETLKDATGKEMVGPDGKAVHKLIANPEIESIYKPALASVKEAYDELVKTIAAIVANVPTAITSINIEKMFRDSNVAKLKKAIKTDQGIVGSKGASKAAKKNAGERLAKNKKRLTFEQGEIKDILSDRKQFGEDRKEAGFDLRQAVIDRGEVQSDYDGISGRATTEATTGNDQATDSGGGPGGGPDTGPTIQQQASMADTERANILKDYGGNTYGVGAAGAAGTPGGGMQTNLAGIAQAMTGPVASAATAAAASVVGGPAAKAFSGGAAAGSMMAARTANAATGSTATGSTGGDKTVNITNNFDAPPADPHTWTQGIEFEAGAVL